MDIPKIIVTGGSEDGSVPNDFWFQNESGEKVGPFETFNDAVIVSDHAKFHLQIGEE